MVESSYVRKQMTMQRKLMCNNLAIKGGHLEITNMLCYTPVITLNAIQGRVQVVTGYPVWALSPIY